MSIVLNEQQANAVKKAREWYHAFKCGKPNIRGYFEISGPPGSGKTTIVRTIINELGLDLESVMFMAYVGKATLQLTRNGTPARTIHSSLYDYKMVPVRVNGEVSKDRHGHVIYEKRFVKKDMIDPRVKLFVVDEGAMVDEMHSRDVLSFNVPTIVLGDLNQLPPVFGQSFFLRHPDIILTEIMRQALGNPILALADEILRNGHRLEIRRWGDHCRVISKEDLKDKYLTDEYTDCVICGKNNTRDILNHHIRCDILGRYSEIPVIGDTMIARNNNWNLSLGDGISLVNGMSGVVEDINRATFNGNAIALDFRPDFLYDRMFHNLPIDVKYLNMPSNMKKGYFTRMNKLEYGYAITGHLSQGSQYDRVLAYPENFGGWDFNKRWLYTVVTRAVNDLIVAI